MGISIALIIVLQVSLSDAGCREARLCCQGQDNDCTAESGCYCDFFCLGTSNFSGGSTDCCEDFQDYCVNQGIKLLYQAIISNYSCCIFASLIEFLEKL